jgi:hypothetical protein
MASTSAIKWREVVENEFVATDSLQQHSPRWRSTIADILLHTPGVDERFAAAIGTARVRLLTSESQEFTD